jgi:hypothetical protein
MRERYQPVYALAMLGGRSGRKPHLNLWSARLIGGFVAGLVVGGACATSDQVLEKKRREQQLAEGGGYSCSSGTSEECYEGPDGTAGRGACRLGRHSCIDEKWGPCEGQVIPTNELCNGVDDNCDGVVDNGFERDGALCSYQGAKGACKTEGKWHCSEDGTKSECDAPLVKPTAETCDGIDNDCDGETDEDSIPAGEQECTTGLAGVCNPGTNHCIKGQIKCVQNVKPGPEICNRLDDNCNGEIDDDCVSEAEAAKLKQ